MANTDMLEVTDVSKIIWLKPDKPSPIAGMKVCCRCKKSKPLDKFCDTSKYKHPLEGRQYACKECKYISYAKSVGKTTDQIVNRLRSRIINGHKLCIICKQLKTPDYFYNSPESIDSKQNSCKQCVIWNKRVISRIARMEFILAYGGKCSCCGEKELDLLTVEHIRNKGHELIYGGFMSLVPKLKKLGWPKGYTVLCWNCNCSTANGRPCVHSKEYKEYENELEVYIRKDFIKYKDYKELKNKLGSIKQ